MLRQTVFPPLGMDKERAVAPRQKAALLSQRVPLSSGRRAETAVDRGVFLPHPHQNCNEKDNP
jgi:hypothetical protein